MPRLPYGTLRTTRRRRIAKARRIRRGTYTRPWRLRVKRRRLTIPRSLKSLGAFPPRKTVALRYVDTVALNPGAGGTAVQVFRANSIYDPDYTGAGHQPMFYDNYANIYGRYKVNYATITMIALSSKIVNTTSSTDLSGTTTAYQQYYASNERACRMFILNDMAVNDYPSALNTLIEEGNKNLVWRYVPNNTGLKMPILRQRVTPHKLAGVSYNDDSMVATVGADPNKDVFFICGVSDIGDGTNPDSMYFQFIITYNVTFSDLKKNQTQN